MPVRAPVAAAPPCLVVFATRERVRTAARVAFPRRRARLIVGRTASEFGAAFHSTLIDAALVDVGTAADDAWRAAELAREFPSVPFFAVTPMRGTDAPAVARCAALEFTDIVVDSVDDDALRDLVLPATFSTRFFDALQDPPPSLGITQPMQHAAWRCVVAHAGRTLRTDALAEAVGVTREHLSRTFSAAGAPNLKRVIDLVRLISRSEEHTSELQSRGK